MNTQWKTFFRIATALVFAGTLGELLSSANAADFDADGYDDLVVGAPAEDLSAADTNAGIVNILYGGSYGIDSGTQAFGQLWAGESEEADDLFGSALAIGNFNCDGYFDVAIGVIGEDIEGPPYISGAGMVHVMYGAATGLNPLTAQTFYQGHDGLAETPEAFDGFGAALAAGDFNGGGCDDLAIGVPYEDVETPTVSAAGVVQVLYGSIHGLTTLNDEVWTQEDLSGLVENDTGNHFGETLAAGDLNRDSYEDLVIGVPDQAFDSGDIPQGGLIQIAYGSATGLVRSHDSVLWQSEASGDGSTEEGDRFGDTLVVGHFNDDDYADIAVGIPLEDTTLADAGAVQIIYGGGYHLMYTHVDGDNLFSLNDLSAGSAHASDHFGFSLAAGDFDANGLDDLAVGAPDVDFASALALGFVFVLRGTATGVAIDDYQVLGQAPFGMGGEAEVNDRVGYSLASGYFNSDPYADLAVGVPYEDNDADDPQTLDTGAVNIVFGGRNLVSGTRQYLYQGAPNIDGEAESGDHYGEVLAALPRQLEFLFLPIMIR